MTADVAKIASVPDGYVVRETGVLRLGISGCRNACNLEANVVIRVVEKVKTSFRSSGSSKRICALRQ